MDLGYNDWNLMANDLGHNTEYVFKAMTHRVRPDVARAFDFAYRDRGGFISTRDESRSLFLRKMDHNVEFCLPAIPPEYLAPVGIGEIPKFHIIAFTQFEKYFIKVVITLLPLLPNVAPVCKVCSSVVFILFFVLH